MKYLIDTNICIHFFRGKFDLIGKLNRIENDLIMVTENSTEFERIEGIRIENWVQRN